MSFGTWKKVINTNIDPDNINTTVVDNSILTTANTRLFCNATSKNIIVTLPTAKNNKYQYIIKKTDSSVNTVTINTVNSELVEGSLTYVLDKQFKGVTIASDGTNWFVINKSDLDGYGY
jgi:hypothetical protein